jgi:glycine cleavage system H protein
VVEVNAELEDAPELINQDAFGSGWIFKLKMSDESDVDNMLDADSYEELLPSDD